MDNNLEPDILNNLEDLKSHPLEHRKLNAAHFFSSIHDQRALPVLLEHVSDQKADYELRAICAAAIARYPPKTLMEHGAAFSLSCALKEEKTDCVIGEIAKTLSVIGNASCVCNLLKAIEEIQPLKNNMGPYSFATKKILSALRSILDRCTSVEELRDFEKQAGACRSRLMEKPGFDVQSSLLALETKCFEKRKQLSSLGGLYLSGKEFMLFCNRAYGKAKQKKARARNPNTA
jgi:hypothetical protein